MSAPAADLPGRLPEGERMLWQGKPDWRVMARRVFRLRLLAAYFGAILAWAAVTDVQGGMGLTHVAMSVGRLAALAAVPLAVIALYAWATGRATSYTVTTKRIIIRMGVALPMTINLPFSRIDAAGLRPARDGSGDIALRLAAGNKLAYLLLWPHARPWRLTQPEPMLRALPDAARAAHLLSRALAAEADAPVPAIGELQEQGQAVTIGATIGATRLRAAASA